MANLGIEIKRKCPICGKVFIIKTLEFVSLKVNVFLFFVHILYFFVLIYPSWSYPLWCKWMLSNRGCTLLSSIIILPY